VPPAGPASALKVDPLAPAAAMLLVSFRADMVVAGPLAVGGRASPAPAAAAAGCGSTTLCTMGTQPRAAGKGAIPVSGMATRRFGRLDCDADTDTRPLNGGEPPLPPAPFPAGAAFNDPALARACSAAASEGAVVRRAADPEATWPLGGFSDLAAGGAALVSRHWQRRSP